MRNWTAWLENAAKSKFTLSENAKYQKTVSTVLAFTNACFNTPAVASSLKADRLQAGMPCSLVTGWTSSSLPRWGYSPRCCRSRSPAPFLYGQVVQCPTHVQHVRQQKICRSRDSCVEQSTIESTRRKTQFSELQAPAVNSLVYCWPQRNVNNYSLRYRNALTYLLH